MQQLDAVGGSARFATDGSQFLTFALGDEQYGTEILLVQEIKGYSPVTPIPSTPPYMKGVMNLRGNVIPVVDLRTKLGMAEAAYNQFTVIIVVRVASRTVGLVVDTVSDVLDIPRDNIQAVPDLGAQVDLRFVSGVAKAGEKLVILLDMERVLGNAELSILAG